VSLVNSTKHTPKKPRLRWRTDRAWFSHLLWHVARKQSRSLLARACTRWDQKRHPSGLLHCS